MEAGSNLTPRSDVVVIERGKDEYRGKLVLPDSAQKTATWGIVRAVGRDYSDDFPVGECVIFKRDTGTEYSVDGNRLLFIKGDDVLAIYER